MIIDDAKKVFDLLFKDSKKVIVGQEELLKQMIVALLADSHALIEGYPGLAKTLAVKTLAQLMDLRFARIQGTPDLMPSDITGTYMIETTSSGKNAFKFQYGPVFANVVLADEINRATPKTQSALLEAMQEKQVTVGNETFKLDLPFFVIATQNPIEQEGSLALDQQVFINGEFIDGFSLLKKTKANNCEILESNGKCLYKLQNSYTLSMNYEGKIVRTTCWLYTLPYCGQLINIETEKGRKISVTSNHPFVFDGNSVLLWKKAEELKIGDSIVCPAFSTIQKELIKGSQELNLSYYENNSENDQSSLLLYNLKSYSDLVSERIVSLKIKQFSGTVFGLAVPGLQNYIAGFGGCGINHNTYPLPEAQSDRFLLKIKINYPSYDEELEIINKYTEVMRDRELKPVISKKMLLELQNITRQVPIANDIKKQIVDIVTESRKKKDMIEYGASPRASIGLVLAAKARALVEGRKYVSKDDVNTMAYPVLRHRIILSFDAERQNLTEDDVIKKLIK